MLCISVCAAGFYRTRGNSWIRINSGQPGDTIWQNKNTCGKRTRQVQFSSSVSFLDYLPYHIFKDTRILPSFVVAHFMTRNLFDVISLKIFAYPKSRHQLQGWFSIVLTKCYAQGADFFSYPQGWMGGSFAVIGFMYATVLFCTILHSSASKGEIGHAKTAENNYREALLGEAWLSSIISNSKKTPISFQKCRIQLSDELIVTAHQVYVRDIFRFTRSSAGIHWYWFSRHNPFEIIEVCKTVSWFNKHDVNLFSQPSTISQKLRTTRPISYNGPLLSQKASAGHPCF